MSRLRRFVRRLLWGPDHDLLERVRRGADEMREANRVQMRQLVDAMHVFARFNDDGRLWRDRSGSWLTSLLWEARGEVDRYAQGCRVACGLSSHRVPSDEERAQNHRGELYLVQGRVTRMFLRVRPLEDDGIPYDDVLAVAPADVSQPWRWAAQFYSSAAPTVWPSGFYPGKTAAEAVERALAAEGCVPV